MMDIQKEREDFEKLPAVAELIKTNNVWWSEVHGDYFGSDHELDCWIDGAWAVWQAKSQAVPECVWVESYDGSVFESSCGHTFELSNDGTLDDNNMKHCCFCGGKIEAQEQSHE